jgi:hypothetical protein
MDTPMKEKTAMTTIAELQAAIADLDARTTRLEHHVLGKLTAEQLAEYERTLSQPRQ